MPAQPKAEFGALTVVLTSVHSKLLAPVLPQLIALESVSLIIIIISSV